MSHQKYKKSCRISIFEEELFLFLSHDLYKIGLWIVVNREYILSHQIIKMSHSIRKIVTSKKEIFISIKICHTQKRLSNEKREEILEKYLF